LDRFRQLKGRRVRLTADEEHALFERLKTGGPRARASALREVVELYTPLVRSLVRRVRGFTLIGRDDLEQEGAIALVRAARAFNPDRGVWFTIFATPVIRRGLWRAIEMQRSTIRIPLPVVAALRELARASRVLLAELGREPEPHELAARLGVAVDRVLELRAIGFVERPRSLEEPVATEDGRAFSLGDTIADAAPSPEERAADGEQRREIGRAIADLPARTAEITRAMLEGCSAIEIARAQGLSRARIYQVRERALKDLRQAARRP
jgi:RNA polymerase primary sigma factor